MSELVELANMLNQSGGIPLVVTTVNKTNWTQFFFTAVMGGIGVLWLLSTFLGVAIKQVVGMVSLWLFKLKLKTRNIIVIKHTSSDMFISSMINRSTLEKIQKALMKFKGKDIDLILYTPGGEIFSAVYISRLLKKYGGKIRSFVPTFAMSGGTLLALSTDEIYLNDYACLGAVDPQLGNLFKFGSARSWKEVLKIKGKKAEDSSISFKFMGEQYTKSIKNLVGELLDSKVEKKNIKQLKNLFVSGDIEHGYNLTRDLLNNMGMNIGNIDDEMNIKLTKLVERMPEGVTYI